MSHGLPREHIHATADTCPPCQCGSATTVEDLIGDGQWLCLVCSDSGERISRAVFAQAAR